MQHTLCLNCGRLAIGVWPYQDGCEACGGEVCGCPGCHAIVNKLLDNEVGWIHGLCFKVVDWSPIDGWVMEPIEVH